jgi:hypothetical protein
MSIDARLGKLMPALSAQERAILILRSLKEKTPEDPLWRSTMPREQAAEFNRLIVAHAPRHQLTPEALSCMSPAE